MHVECDRVHPGNDRVVIPELFAPFPTLRPGGLGDLACAFRRHPAGTQKPEREIETPLVCLAVIVLSLIISWWPLLCIPKARFRLAVRGL